MQININDTSIHYALAAAIWIMTEKMKMENSLQKKTNEFKQIVQIIFQLSILIASLLQS